MKAQGYRDPKTVTGEGTESAVYVMEGVALLDNHGYLIIVKKTETLLCLEVHMLGERISFLGLPLDVGLTEKDVCDLLRNKGECRTSAKINPGVWAIAARDPEYLAVLSRMTCVLADGEGVAAACRLLMGKDCRRMSFDMTSLADPFFKTAVEINASLMLVGSEPNVCDEVRDKLVERYKGLHIIDTMHGYGEFGPKVAEIIAKNPDALVVGMGVPRQEKFVDALRQAGYKGLAFTCGGFFDQYLLAEDYYPVWINRFNLRFLYRIYMEPRRLWRRYLIDYQFFIVKFAGALSRKLLLRGN